MNAVAVQYLCTVPQELFLYIATFLNYQDVLSLRKTCKQIDASTRDKALWKGLLRRQQISIPLPSGARASDDITFLTSNQLEHIVVSAQVASDRWLIPRKELPRRPKPSRLGESIILFELFMDRFLACVYAEGVISLWDLGSRLGKEYHTTWLGIVKPDEGLSWSSAAAVADEDGGILIVVTKTGGPSLTRVLRVHTDQMADGRLAYEVVASVTHALPLFARAISPPRSSLAFSRSCYVEIYNWKTQLTQTISTQSEELDELWNGIIGVRFHGEYIICMKTRSIELYPLPATLSVVLAIDTQSCPAPTLGADATRLASSGCVYTFPSTTFRGLSLSAPQPSGAADTTIFSLLAYDILKGLFHYRIVLRPMEADPTAPLFLNIQLVGSHSMAYGAQEAGLRSSTVHARGFVSACCLGPEGKRGMWIERTRGSVKRSVIVFSASDDGREGGEVNFNAEGKIDGRVVYESNSYDLREDLTHCVFCEASGLIVLGTRLGEIQVLCL